MIAVNPNKIVTDVHAIRTLADARWRSTGHGSCRCQKARSSQSLDRHNHFHSRGGSLLETDRQRHFAITQASTAVVVKSSDSERSGNTEALAAVSVMGVRIGLATTGARQNYLWKLTEGSIAPHGAKVPCVTSIAGPHGAAQLYWR
jgi:hypothetical protein